MQPPPALLMLRIAAILLKLGSWCLKYAQIWLNSQARHYCPKCHGGLDKFATPKKDLKVWFVNNSQRAGWHQSHHYEHYREHAQPEG